MIRHTAFALLALSLAATGCSKTSLVTSAGAKVASRAQAADAQTPLTWTGNWVPADGNDAAPAGPVPACMTHWHLGQEGTQFVLDADRNPDGGPMPTYLQFESATGTLQNGTLTLTGSIAFSPTGSMIGMPAPQPVTYVLTLDPAKGHIVGTRNGQPFWAAPFKASTDAACGQLPL